MSPPSNPLFKSRRLPALAAYEFLVREDGSPRRGCINEPLTFRTPWASPVDWIIVSYLYQTVRHSDPEDTWGFVFSSRELADELSLALSSVKRSLRRLERAGVIIRRDDVRILFAHPYTVALARLGQTLSDDMRDVITEALEREGSFKPVHRVLRERGFVFGGDAGVLETRLPALEKGCIDLLKHGGEMLIAGSNMSRARLINEPSINNSDFANADRDSAEVASL